MLVLRVLYLAFMVILVLSYHPIRIQAFTSSRPHQNTRVIHGLFG